MDAGTQDTGFSSLLATLEAFTLLCRHMGWQDEVTNQLIHNSYCMVAQTPFNPAWMRSQPAYSPADDCTGTRNSINGMGVGNRTIQRAWMVTLGGKCLEIRRNTWNGNAKHVVLFPSLSSVQKKAPKVTGGSPAQHCCWKGQGEQHHCPIASSCMAASLQRENTSHLGAWLKNHLLQQDGQGSLASYCASVSIMDIQRAGNMQQS